ncbi:MAG: GIY-YIG nuclease family protein [Deltaproteobacteria bacterium]|nr:GIY-YIG nuclease family protein [Deltaproteobacteria bacterium]
MSDEVRVVVEERSGWFVYLLRCKDDTLYCGITNRLSFRIAAHNAGKGARYTRGRGPVDVVWLCEVSGQSEALRIEARLKKWPRREKESLIRGRL